MHSIIYQLLANGVILGEGYRNISTWDKQNKDRVVLSLKNGSKVLENVHSNSTPTIWFLAFFGGTTFTCSGHTTSHITIHSSQCTAGAHTLVCAPAAQCVLQQTANETTRRSYGRGPQPLAADAWPHTSTNWTPSYCLGAALSNFVFGPFCLWPAFGPWSLQDAYND